MGFDVSSGKLCLLGKKVQGKPCIWEFLYKCCPDRRRAIYREWKENVGAPLKDCVRPMSQNRFILGGPHHEVLEAHTPINTWCKQFQICRSSP